MSEIAVLGTRHQIVINEAVDLAKRFCDGAAPRIINGCLRTFVKDFEETSTAAALEARQKVVSCYMKQILCLLMDHISHHRSVLKNIIVVLAVDVERPQKIASCCLVVATFEAIPDRNEPSKVHNVVEVKNKIGPW